MFELESQGGGSAYRHRQFGILASVVAKFEDSTMDAAAGEFVDEALELLTPAGQRNAYSNIARKGDSLEVMLGNSGRVERLKEIKKTWDPENQFKGVANLL
ncbi:hypothetical protein V494_00967 [Pseudogymnoascus sp. VKM F-4513 (FW-928)]|nr:hypothetical protein V494_00967 [Pseudogymnoascus sp. VKM F-4513 (FW-928)]